MRYRLGVLAFVSLARGSATSATSRLLVFRTHNPYPQHHLVHGCALAFLWGNHVQQLHAWTGMNYLPQAPQSSALPNCATARRPISTGQENITGQSTSLAVGHNPSTAHTHSHVPHRLAKRVGQAPGDSDATVTRQALESMRWSRSNLEYRR